jgi:hypothetical protein
VAEFYSERTDRAFRFGDILQGLVLASPIANNLPVAGAYTIEVSSPLYTAILSPCCSIGEKTICLCPLVKIKKDFFNNPYFDEDMTRINRVMDLEQAVSPHVWNQLSPEEKDRRLQKGCTYALVDLFIYARHDLLQAYQLGSLSTNYYMIDFRHISRVQSDKIINTKTVPLDLKILQLTVGARQDLRDKIAHYFGRIPDEDNILG